MSVSNHRTVLDAMSENAMCLADNAFLALGARPQGKRHILSCNMMRQILVNPHHVLVDHASILSLGLWHVLSGSEHQRDRMNAHCSGRFVPEELRRGTLR